MTELVQGGPYVHGVNGINWLVQKFCCEGSRLSKELLCSATETGAAIGIHTWPFAVEDCNPHSKSALDTLHKLCSHGSQPPCNKVVDAWMAHLAQPAVAADPTADNSISNPAQHVQQGSSASAAARPSPLFVLCGGKPYWEHRPFFQAGKAQGRVIERCSAVMQQHNKKTHQFWKLSPQYYKQQDLNCIINAVTAGVARLQQSPLPPPILPPTGAYPFALRLRCSDGSAPTQAPAAEGAAPPGVVQSSGTATPADDGVHAPLTPALAPALASTPAPAPAPAAEANGGSGSSSSHDGTQQHQQDQPEHQEPHHPCSSMGAAAAALLAVKPDPGLALQGNLPAFMAGAGPAERQLLAEAHAHGFLWPNAEQLFYFGLADVPFDGEELLSLHQDYCSSWVFASKAPLRSGRVRGSLVKEPQGRSRVERHYPEEALPGFATALLQLRDAVPGLAEGTWKPPAADAAAAAAEAAAAAAAAAAAPVVGGRAAAAATAACKLLLALRCLKQWEGKRTWLHQPQPPALLQLLLSGAPRSWQHNEAIEVISLVEEEEEEDVAWEMAAGDVDVMLVRDVAPRGSKRTHCCPEAGAAGQSCGTSGVGTSSQLLAAAAKRVKQEQLAC